MIIRGNPLYLLMVLFILSKVAYSDQTDRTFKKQELNANLIISSSLEKPEYRIQILAYKNIRKAPDGYFSELRKIGTIKAENHNGYKIFTLGSYHSYGEARLRLKNVKKFMHDAFVVAFVDGKRVDHLTEINPYIMDQDVIPDTGTVFRIHITETTGRPVSIIELAFRYNLRESEILEEKKDGKYIYSTRTFRNVKDALNYAEELRNNNLVKDAYILKYIDGKQVNTAFSSIVNR